MKGPVRCSARVGPTPTRVARGYTLVELLIATTLTLILMFVVVTIFAAVSRSISDSRATLEMTGRLRDTRSQLKRDLEALTVTVSPPRRPEADEGYLEIIEGPVGPASLPYAVAVNADTGEADTTAGDFDDILMFTIRSRGAPFVGRYGSTTLQSHEAEVAWFVRGRTLYRRVLLIAPQVVSQLDADGDGVIGPAELGAQSFFDAFDISARPALDSAGRPGWVPNTLGDLTKRENRFAHRLHRSPLVDGFPYDARRWGQLGLPTLRECSHANWMTWSDLASVPSVTPAAQIDLWSSNPHPWPEVDPVTGTLTAYMGPRIADDVILTDVIGFDVKVWDPRAPVFEVGGAAILPGDPGYLSAMTTGAPLVSYGAYVDLNYAGGNAGTVFDGPGQAGSQLNTGAARVYDTWSSHYEHNESWIDLDGDGSVDANERFGDEDGDGAFDEGTNGFDDNGDGVVDDAGEMETSPPYPVPLRGIQVKIRTFEPDSRQVREVTVIQDFLSK